jgi:hypothetical protein
LHNLFFAETDLGLLDAAMQLHEKTQGSVFIIFEGRPTHDSLCHLFKCFRQPRSAWVILPWNGSSAPPGIVIEN